MRKPLVLGLLIGLLLTACQQSSSLFSQARDYQSRIHNILDKPLPEQQQKKTWRFPEKRALKLAIGPIEIPWRTFFSLDQCRQLQQLIAQRNSQLGKVMEAATRLEYEKHLLAGLSECRQLAPEQAELIDALYQAKEAQQTSHLWNTTWASEYWQGLFSSANQSTDYRIENHQQVIAALSTIRSAELSDGDGWYQAFATLEASKGILWNLINELNQQQWYMSQITQALGDSLQSVCPQQQKTITTDYLANVLNKFFLRGLQREQSQMVEAVRLWQSELNQWRDLIPAQQVNLLVDIQGRLDVESFLNASRAHVQQWQQISDYCNTQLI